MADVDAMRDFARILAQSICEQQRRDRERGRELEREREEQWERERKEAREAERALERERDRAREREKVLANREKYNKISIYSQTFATAVDIPDVPGRQPLIVMMNGAENIGVAIKNLTDGPEPQNETERTTPKGIHETKPLAARKFCTGPCGKCRAWGHIRRNCPKKVEKTEKKGKVTNI